jgi:hypothetical protein
MNDRLRRRHCAVWVDLIVPVAAAVVGALITITGMRRCRDVSCEQAAAS